MDKVTGKAVYEDPQKPDLTGQIGSISRDPFGVNPLYYIDSEKGFFWASEMKDLIPFVKEYGLDWTLNEEVLFEYMMFRYTAGRNTLIKKVKRVLPGEILFFDKSERGTINKRTYYGWDRKNEKEFITSEDEALEFIEGKLIENIKQMYSDDTAVILSGGVDSSLLAALTSMDVKKGITTFSTVFKDDKDERKYSDLVAEQFGTDHHNYMIDSESYADSYLEAVWHNDEPINFANSVAIMMMSKFAEEKGFNKIMAGEGADEVFAGYGFFFDPRPLMYRTQYALPSDIMCLLNIKPNTNHFEYRLDLLKDNPYAGTSGDQWYTFYTYLQAVLNRLNKMTVSQDIEVTCPYFTLDMIEDIFYQVPDDLKVKDGTTKYILKKLAEKYFPKDFVHRKKVGFSIPINSWLRDEQGLGRYVKILLEDRTLDRGIYNADGIRNLVNALYNKKDSETFTIAGRIWILLNLEMWIRTFVEEKSKINL